jgi:hypothetical protein
MGMKLLYSAIIVGLVIFGTLDIYAFKGSRQPKLATNSEIEYWRSRIEAVGADNAYSELIARYAGKPDVSGHVDAHQFGAALYLEKGLAGITTCDSRLEYGCLHQFIGYALQDRGLSVMSQIQSYCASQGPQSLCEHGIGHGLVASIGYTQKDIAEALQLCRSSAVTSEQGGKCVAGAYMEYMNRTMLGPATSPLPVDTDDVFASCDSASSEDKPECISALPRDWIQALWSKAPTSTAAARAVGGYCEQLDDANTMRACFSGIGNVAYDYEGGDISLTTDFCRNSTSLVAMQDACTSELEMLETIGTGADGT